MLYGSEVWGVYNFKSKLHLRFSKYILGVKKTDTKQSLVVFPYLFYVEKGHLNVGVR